MDFIRESKRRPKLTSELTNELVKFKPKPSLSAPPVTLPPVKQVNVKWNLNGILIVGFIVFLIFFLYNCKYGFFQTADLEPYAFS
jgi:hypothetical protein